MKRAMGGWYFYCSIRDGIACGTMRDFGSFRAVSIFLLQESASSGASD
jgi:hypothetical protein